MFTPKEESRHIREYKDVEIVLVRLTSHDTQKNLGINTNGRTSGLWTRVVLQVKIRAKNTERRPDS